MTIMKVAQRGALLIAAVVLIAVIAVLASTLSFLQVGSTTSGGDHLRSAQALFVAESGLEHAAYQFKQGSTCAASASTQSVGLGSFTTTAAANSASTILSSGITTTATEIPLTSTSGFGAHGRITIGREAINYAAIAGLNLTGATRGRMGTTALAYPSGTAVTQVQCMVTSTGTVGLAQRQERAAVLLPAITYQAPGAIAYSAGTSVAPAYPASIAVGDLLVLIIGMKPSTANSGSVTTPTGWTAITSLTGAGGYGGALGGDTGNTNVFTFFRVAPGVLTGTLAVTIATNNVSWAQMYRLSNATGVWSVAGTTGSDITGGTAVSVAMGANPGVTAGDFILGAFNTPTDIDGATKYSLQALSQAGITFGTVTEISEPNSSLGNDIGAFTYRAPVSSGTASAAPTLTATAGGTTTNVRGPGVFIRAREITTHLRDHVWGYQREVYP